MWSQTHALFQQPASGLPQGKKVAVALSGGLDSVVLLHLLKDRRGLSAIHVHHGLSPNADAWAAFCKKLCKAWNVPLTVPLLLSAALQICSGASCANAVPVVPTNTAPVAATAVNAAKKIRRLGRLVSRITPSPF